MESLYGLTPSIPQASSQPEAQPILSHLPPAAAQASASFAAEGRALAPKRSYRRKAKADKTAKIPRPPNAFILFRSDTQPTLVDAFRGAGKSSRDYSAAIAKLWADATVEVKQKYNHLAAEKMLQHREKYPDYRYRPKRNALADSATRPKPAGINVDQDDRNDYMSESKRVGWEKGGKVAKRKPKGRRPRAVVSSPSPEILEVSMSMGEVGEEAESGDLRKGGKARKANHKEGLSRDEDNDIASSPSLLPELEYMLPRAGEAEKEESFYFDNIVSNQREGAVKNMGLDTPPITNCPSSVSTPFFENSSFLDAKMSSAIPKYLASKQTRVRKQQFTSFSAPDTTPPSEPDLTGRELLLHFQQELSFLNMRLFELEEENERVQRRYGLPALVIHT